MTDRNWAETDQRYTLQAEWSESFRSYVYRMLDCKTQISVLEVGCGTGAVMRSVREEFPGKLRILIGIDKDKGALDYSNNPEKSCRCVSLAESLPFPNESFDFVYCHYLLLWVKDAVRVLQEMHRVIRKGGICSAFAEPCYAEMNAKPQSLYKAAQRQRQYLCEQGASMNIGQQLGTIFNQAGFDHVEWGQYQQKPMSENYLQSEIEQMRIDLGDQFLELKDGKNYFYAVPTYFALAEK